MLEFGCWLGSLVLANARINLIYGDGRRGVQWCVDGGRMVFTCVDKSW